MKKDDIVKKAQEVVEQMYRDWDKWCDRSEMSESTRSGQDFTFEIRRNFIKFISGGSQKSVNGFLVINPPKGIDNKTGEGFQVGDLLMAASWNQPAKNFARGNVFKENWEDCIRWTGVL